ncbi:gliding motility-associated C-terminal domain-containing protein [Flavobacterium pectinovorum]|uniref:Gliding motility-associated C-terminal domain-containing protein n=2 Tax=Flavobacterium pectinovorum TaxID=29533 RepID=A0AB36P408_9FLAO|nr:hypothetical protein B0A72_05865 [Flavobacterium pectinovorum]SHL94702.1 gliding motility-associated C-terminal domain-containing protein [Flavobacterium pectinovorum]
MIMKKPTILRTLIFALALLLNFVSYSQNLIAFNAKINHEGNKNLFLQANNQFINKIGFTAKSDTVAKGLAAAITHPVIKYATGTYAGTVAECPIDGSFLPKLFLCGDNDSRLIQTTIANATKIVWQRRTGGCTPISNGNCPNVAANCSWAGVAEGADYNANSAGEFRVIIRFSDNTESTFYFNVYKTEVDPTGIIKSDIITGSTACVIPGKIMAVSFPTGSGYEYSFTTNPTPNTWQDSNTFETTTPDTYNVFMRLKGITGGCIYSVKNIVVSRFRLSTSLAATQPGCVGQKGSIKVTANGVNNDYTYAIFKNPSNTALTTTPTKSVPEHEFTGLDAGTYTVVTTIKGTNCNVTDTQTTTITAANQLNNTSYISTSLSSCNTGVIQGRANGGAGGTYRYFVNYNNTGFVDVPTTRVIVDKAGTYIMRVEDLNGCTADLTINVSGNNVVKPVYSVDTALSGNCNPTGTITVNVTNTNGYAYIEYSKDNGTTWQSSNVFSNLPAGDYNITVRYKVRNRDDWCTDAFTTKTIGTTTALTASAGVAALPGCRTGDDLGIVRITNPQGGTPPYEYFFSNAAVNHNGWSTYNEGYLAAGGPYTVRIRDSKGCTYDMTGITIDTKPTPPSITYGPLVYNCDGTGSQTVSINNGAGDPRYNFTYYLDGNPNPNTANPNVFLNIPTGTHIISVDYNVKSASTYSNLLDESFGSGANTTSPGINTFYYCFERQLANQPATWCNGAYAINDGDYSVTSSINQAATNGWNWRYPIDHTSGTAALQGRFLAVNIGDQIPVTTILYEKQINDVIPNQPIMFEFYAMNLMMPNAGKADANLRIALVDASGTEISWFATGNIPRSSSGNDWKKYPQTAITLDPGNNTSLRLIVRSNVQATEGNDVAIDDIKVFQVPRVCGAQFQYQVTVTPPPPFIPHIQNLKGESCAGAGDGSFEIFGENFTGEFYYSINNQEPFIRSTVNPVKIGPLAAATYSVRVRRDPTSQGCDFDIPTTITAPAKFTIDATATVATCNTTSVVTAIIGGGTAPYNISLTRVSDGKVFPFVLDSDGKYKVKDTDITPGSYKVSGVDGGPCSASKATDLIISGSTPPTVTIESTSNLCFNETAGADIVVRIAGGKGPFSYRVKLNPGTYGAWSTTFAGPTFTHHVTTSGTYDFEIMDANSCSAQVISQQIDPKLTAKSAVTTSISCKATGTDAIIQVTITGGTAPYTYVIKNSLGTVLPGGGTTTNPIFTYSTGISDTYTFEIQDANKCPISITQKVNALVAVTAESKTHDAKCIGQPNGSVDLEGLTGTAPFTFQFNGTGAFTSTTHYDGLAGSAAGTDYSFTVKDANDCVRTYTFKIFEPAIIEGVATIAPTYNCEQPATITVSGVKGGTPAYKYTLLKDGVIVAGPQDGAVFSNITVAGVYTVTISDANSCSQTIAAGTINALNPPTGMTITTTTAATCPTNKGSVTITNVVNAAGVAVPTAGLEYRISLPASATTAFQSSNVFNGLDANVLYTFEVRDANKCITSKTHTIALPATFSVGGTPKNITCFGLSDGSITWTVTGIATGGNYSYIVDSGAVQTGTSTGNPFTIVSPSLAAGSHSITVTSTTTNCPVTANATVGGPTAALALNPPTLTHVTCLVKGTAEINAVNGTGTYTYTVTPTAPAGTAIVQANNNLFTNLGAGTYSVSVTDLGGCTFAGQSFTINDKVLPLAQISATSDFCADGGATLIAEPVTAPQPNYEYSINGGTNYFASGTFAGLTPGNYTIIVRDKVTGCTTSLTAQTIAAQVAANAQITKDLDCTTTTPTSANAIIKVDISSGYPDYRYRVNTTGAPFSGAYTTVGAGLVTFNYSAATAATYYFEITDSKGCTTVVSRTVDAKVLPDFTAEPDHVLCKGASTGSITVNGIPSTGTYEYILKPISPAGATVTQTTNKFENLPAGSYEITIVDAKKCVSAPKTVSINEPTNGLSATAAVTTKLTCDASNTAQSATITVTATGGTPFAGVNPYRYSYNGQTPVTSNTYTTTTAGTVTIVVTDASNCPFTVPAGVVIDALNPPTNLVITPSNAITCKAAELDADLTLTFTNGVSPFKYEITSPSAPAVTNIAGRSYTFTNLAVGNYSFKVTDANNCTITGDYEIKAVTPITVSGSIVSAITCNGLSNGAIKFAVGGNSTGFTYVLRNAANAVIPGGTATATEVNFTGLPVGVYTLTVTNPATGCSAPASVTLTAPAAINITSASGTKVFCTEANTTITVTASGGTVPLSYAVVKTGVTPVAANYNTTGVFTKDTSVDGLTYDVYVSDGNSCPATSTVTIIRNAEPTINPVVAAQCYSGASFTVTITGSVYNGLANAQFGLNGAYNTNQVKTITGPGIYTLGIKDDNGCEKTTTIEVNDQLTLEAKLTKDLTCPTTPPTATAAQINLSASGGDGTYAYAYRIAPSPTYIAIPGAVFNPTVAGQYFFRVTSDGCSAVSTVAVDVTSPVLPVITGITQTQFIKCNGDETAAISITIDNTKGVAPFVFNVQRTAPTAFNYGTQTSGLAAGTYTVTVTDGKGCVDTENITISAPLPIDFSLAKVDITCNNPGGSSLGEVTVQGIVGGTAPFKYFISNNFGDVIAGNPYVATARENHTFTVINYGIYTVNVVDANGCALSKNITIASPPSDLIINVAVTPSDCINGGTARVSVVAPVGSHNYQFGLLETNVSPYTTTWYPADAGFPDQKTFTNLVPGVTYTFVVHDLTTDCYYVKAADAPIAPASPMTSVITPVNVTCTGANDGKVTFTLTNFDATTTSVTYQIFKALTANSPVGPAITAPVTFGTPLVVTYPSPGTLLPGRYYVQFIENGTGSYNGCKSASAAFDIKESSVELSAKGYVIKNANCDNLGVINVEGKDGTAPYVYQVTTSATAPAITDTWETSPNFDRAGSLAGITYYVYVKDANNCIRTDNVILRMDPDPVFALSVPNRCAVEGSFTVNVTVTDATPTMAPYSVSVNGGNFINFTGLTYPATGLNSGEQTIIIQNKNGCKTEHKITINPTPLATAAVTKILDCSVTGNAVADAIIRVTITKGTAPYSYSVKKGTAAYGTATALGAGVTFFDYPVASADADTYTFRITDANSCPVETNSVIIAPIVPIVPDYKPTQPLCYLGNGTIELSAIGGKTPYTYNFNNLGFSNTTIYTVAAGTYPYIIKDALGCEVTGSAILGQPSEVVATTPVITPFTCGTGNVGQSATVVLGATGGSGGYEYSFNNSAFSTTTTYTVIDTQVDHLNIPYSVRDKNGCTKSGTINIYKLDPPINFDMAQTATITCAVTTTTVNISNVRNSAGVIAVPPAVLTYQIVSPVASIVDNGSNPSFTNLGPGTYVFQVTDAATSCIKQLSYEIKDVTKINIVKQSIDDITCLNANDGKASFVVTGFGTGVGTYNYVLDTNPAVTGQTAATINLTLLTPGNHRITVQDDETQCSAFVDFRIETPTLALAIDKVVTPLGCTTKGAVKVTAQNGWGDYLFSLTLPGGAVITNTTGVFDGLVSVGAYAISVKDAKGCVATDSFNLVTPINPVATIAASSVYCYTSGAKSTLVVTASSTSPFILPGDVYEYSINNGQSWQLSNTFNNLNPGQYNITVRDKFGCTATAVNTTITGELFASAEKKKDIFCTGVIDGTIRISAIGGYPTYSYTVTKDGVLDPTVIPFANAGYSDYTVTDPGSYVFTVTDTRTCSDVTIAVDMVSPTIPVFTTTPTSPFCSSTPVVQGNVGNGTILVNLDPVNNNPPYTYTLIRTAPTAGTLVSQGTPLFTDLIAGTYNITVISDRGCSILQTVVLDPATPVVADATAAGFACTPDTNSIKETIVTVTATGGKGTGLLSDYRYSDGTIWYETNTFKVFDTGSVQNLTYYVKDLNGCTDDVQVIINPFPKLISAEANLLVAADCPNSGVETVKVDIVGGTGSFAYQVSVDGGAYSTPATTIATGSTFNYPAPAGHSYQFKITDTVTLCTVFTDVHEVPLYNIMVVNATPSAMVSCKGFTDGSITINIEKYTGTYDYRVLLAGVSVASGTGINAATTNPFTITGLGEGVDYEVEITQIGYPRCVVLSNKVTITAPTVLDISGIVIANVNQNCNTAGAVLTIDESSIHGGTPGYSYLFLPAGSPIPAFADYKPTKTATIATTQISPLFDSIDVYIKDSQNCYTVKTVNISLDPMPTITNVDVVSQCYNAAGYTLQVAATGLPQLQYSIDGQTWQNDPEFIVANPGDYTVTVMDKNGCKVTALVPFTILEPLAAYPEVTIVPLCKNPNGEITIHASGGTVNPANSYVYTIDNWATQQVTNNFPGLAPGDYTFRVRDNVTLCEIEVKGSITFPADIDGFIATPSPVTCFGDSNGSIKITLSDKNTDPVYTYSILGATVNIVDSLSPEFNNLPAGDYTVSVKSGRGCSASITTVTVGTPNPITVPVSNTQYTCAAGDNINSNATITVGTVLGGSGNYVRYVFLRDGTEVMYDGPSNVYAELDHKGGSYTVTVYDDKFCEGTSTTPIDIIPFTTLTGMTFDTKVTKTCDVDETVQVDVQWTGATAPTLQYTLTGALNTVIPPVTNNSGLFTGLGIGDYLITVLNTDTNCSIARDYKVIDPNSFEFKVTKTRTDICFGQADGSVELTMVDNRPTPDDEAGIFNYTITGPMNFAGQSSGITLPLTGLIAGRYNVVATLRDDPKCDVKTSFEITQPTTELKIDVDHTRVTCASGNSDGTITITATGGWGEGTYIYELYDGTTTVTSEDGIFVNLGVGNYIVSARDSKDCKVSEPVDLVIPPAITFNATPTSTVVTCYGDNSGIITISNVAGGKGSDYVYTLTYTSPEGDVTTLGPQPNPVFNGLKAGTYTVTVEDAFSCSATLATTITLTNPTKIEATLSQDKGLTCFTDADLKLTVIGGTGPYTYSVDGNTYSTPAFASETIISAPVGYHIYYVMDSLGCVVQSNGITVEPLTPLSIEVDAANAHVNCKGDFSGLINAIANGGLGDYQYSLVDNSTNLEVRAAQADGIFANLAKGFYTVHVKSGLDCEISKIVEITETEDALIAPFEKFDAKCYLENNGRIVVTASGGKGAIKYAISPHLDQFVDSGTFNDLAAGDYTVIAQDILGCHVIHNITILQPEVLRVSEIPNSMIPEVCEGDKDGAFGVVIAGGTAPYFASLDNRDGTYAPVTGTEQYYTGLVGGMHTVYVRDTNGCTFELEIDMPESVALKPTVEINYDCVNNAQANFVKVDPGFEDESQLDYSLDGGAIQPGNTFTNVPAGDHTITVRHTNGCPAEVKFKINPYTALGAVKATGQQEMNIISVTASGGAPAYEYSFNGEPFTSSNKYKIYKSGDYKVIVRDQNGCTFELIVPAIYVDVCLDNYFTPNGDGVYDNWGPGCTNIYNNLEFSIFDRYGRVIAKYHYGQKWDGRYNGEELPSGDYWYVLKLNDEKDNREFVGHFTLYR